MDSLRGFKERFQENLERLGQAGAAVSIVKDGEVAFAEGFGYKDMEQKLRPDARTLFPIGSATKSFTATGVMLLHERGKLDIDAPVRDILPELAFKDSDATQLATLRDLLCHRTGLPRHDLIWMVRPYISRKELPGLIRYLEPSAPFRAQYQYNNLMFACAGRAIEKADGHSWEEFIGQEILTPLGMTTANFMVDASIVNGNFSLAYERDRKTGALRNVAYSRLGGTAPAGAINANVTELANWSLFNLDKGALRGKALLQPASMQTLFTPMMPTGDGLIQAPEILALGYALGWEVESFRGRTLIHHGGNVAGSSAMVAFMPEINAGVNILVNTGTSMLSYASMYDAFDRLLGYADQKDWAGEFDSGLTKIYAAMDAAQQEQLGERKDAPTKRAPEEFAGVYHHPAYGAVPVEVDNKGRACARLAHQLIPMENRHYDIFTVELDLGFQTFPLTLCFQADAKGNIASMEIPLEGSVKPIVFTKGK